MQLFNHIQAIAEECMFVDCIVAIVLSLAIITIKINVLILIQVRLPKQESHMAWVLVGCSDRSFARYKTAFV